MGFALVGLIFLIFSYRSCFLVFSLVFLMALATFRVIKS